MSTTQREQPWRDDEPGHGRILVLSANPISQAIFTIGTAIGRIVVVLAKGVYREPERTLARVVAALGAQGRPARVTSDEWRLHFPGV